MKTNSDLEEFISLWRPFVSRQGEIERQTVNEILWQMILSSTDRFRLRLQNLSPEEKKAAAKVLAPIPVPEWLTRPVAA